MNTPPDGVAPPRVYPLVAAVSSTLLSPIVHLLFLGPDSLKRPEVWLLSAALGIGVGGVALFFEKRIREEALGLSEDRYTALPLLAKTIASSLDMGEIYHDFVEILQRFMHIDRSTVSLTEERDGEFRILALSARVRTEIEQGRFYPLEGSRIGLILTQGRPAMTDDIRTEAFWDWQVLAEEGLRSAIDIPLREPVPEGADREGRVIGVFSVFSTKLAAYRTVDVDFLIALGEHLSCSLSNVRKHEETRQRSRWLEIMHELDIALGEAKGADDILRIASDHTVRLLQADRTLAVLPENGGETDRKAMKKARWRMVGPGIPAESPWHDLADYGPLVGEVVERQAPMLSRLVAEEALSGTPLEPIYYSEGVRSLAVMPILLAGELYGVLLVGWRQEGAVSQENLQALQDMTQHLAVALRNAKAAGRR